MNLFRKAYDWFGSWFTFKNGQFSRVWLEPRTSSGILVTERSALQTVAVLRCVKLIAGAGAALPIDVGMRTANGRKWLDAHPVARLLDSEPNPEMTSMDFRHVLWVSFLLWGNAYAKITRRPEGTPIALWPLLPDCMETRRMEGTKKLVYVYTPPGSGAPIPYRPEEILHVRNLSFDGINGISTIGLARENVGLNQATELMASKFFQGGMGNRISVTFPQDISEESIKRMQEQWSEKYGSVENAHRLAVFSHGATVSTIGVIPRDAQFLEQRQLNDEQIAMLFGVSPHMIGLVSKTTSWGTGIGEQKNGFMTFTMLPQLVFFEKAFERSLLSEKESELFIKHNVDGFLRVSLKERMEANEIAIRSAQMSPNEARSLEDRDPAAGGDELMVQAQMVPLTQLGQSMLQRGKEPNVN